MLTLLAQCHRGDNSEESPEVGQACQPPTSSRFDFFLASMALIIS